MPAKKSAPDPTTLDRIFFFYGPDGPARRAAVAELRAAFEKKHGPQNFEIFDGADFARGGKWKTLAPLRAAAAAMPFLGAARAILVRDPFSLPADLARDFADFLKNLPPAAVAILAESGAPDRRTALWKFLEKLPRARDFPAPKPAELAARVRAAVPGIAPDLAGEVIRRTGGDPEILARELEKLALFPPEKITAETVAALIPPAENDAPWPFLDAVAARDGRAARAELRGLFAAGEPPQKILALLAGPVRNLLALADLAARGEPEKNWAREIGVAPFALPRLRAGLPRWPDRDLKNFHRAIRRLDETWKSADFSPPETDLAAVLAKFCG